MKPEKKISTDKSICIVILCIMGIMVTNSCRHDTPDVTEMDPICFQSIILPVFQNSCATSGCHSGGNHANGIALDSYSSIVQHVVAFDANSSRVYRAITGRTELMPPHQPLTKDLRTQIWIWIEQGARETTCNGSGNQGTGTKSVCFQRDILPVLRNSCAVSKCHDAATAEEGYVFTSYENVMKSGKLVKAFKPENSLLYHAITTNPNDEHFMPPKPYSPLNKAAIDSIYSWIKKGALDQTCSEACDTSGIISYANQVTKTIQTNCLSCHSGTSPTGGIKLTNYGEVNNAVKNGKLLLAIRRAGGAVAMPPAGAISLCSIRIFELWKKQNYPQ